MLKLVAASRFQQAANFRLVNAVMLITLTATAMF
jgi:hypothetical protein